MLEIREVTKIYKMDEISQTALDKVSINFRKNEFVSILGQSGSGKSTLLNIIGGLDHYTSGDLIINGTSTKNIIHLIGMHIEIIKLDLFFKVII